MADGVVAYLMPGFMQREMAGERCSQFSFRRREEGAATAGLHAGRGDVELRVIIIEGQRDGTLAAAGPCVVVDARAGRGYELPHRKGERMRGNDDGCPGVGSPRRGGRSFREGKGCATIVTVKVS